MSDRTEEQPASDPTMTRQDFIRIVMKRGALAGGLLLAPKVVDKFLVPPVYAATSSPVGGRDTVAGRDTTLNNDRG